MTEGSSKTLPAKKDPPKPIDNIRALLERSKGQIAMALPRHMNADRLLRVAVTAAQKTPKLLECRPVSLVGAVIQCAQLGLEPNDGTGRAWLIPYGTEVQFIPGYRGLVDLARRSGEIKRFDVRAVYEKDVFSYSYGTDPKVEHKPAEGERGDLTHVYAIASFKDGGMQFDVMSRADVDKIRKRSKASSDGPWVTDYDEMAKKTVVRRICKMLPVSVETARAVTLDERAALGLPQNLAMLADPSEKPAPESEAETTYAKPPMGEAGKPEAAAEAEDWREFAVESVSKTTLGKQEVQVIRPKDSKDGEKFYTDNAEVADACREAMKAGYRVAALLFKDSSRTWIQEVRKA